MPPELETLLDRLEARSRIQDSIEAERLHRTVRARLLDETVPETRIDRFVVTRRLGMGGMGVVYAAHDTELDREVAIKLVRSWAGAEHEVDQQRLLAEARALAQLSHPHVVAIYDVGIHRDRVFIAMELVRGKNLRQWVVEPRTTDAIVDAYVQAADGLAAAHRSGLVHRDFKPDNVLIDDATGRARVVDFGLALGHDSEAPQGAATTSAREDATLSTALTASGKVVGTPAYMAPEQLAGQRADARSDQFSFCVALWEALFGERPCDRSTAALRGGGPAVWLPRAPQHPERAPKWLRDVLARGLAFDPSQRWPSMDALASACRRRPISWKRWIAGLAIAATAVGGVLGTNAWRHARARAACESASRTIAAEWDETTTAAITTPFASTGLAHADATAATVGTQLEAFSANLAAIELRACTAHRVDATIVELAWLRREACIDEQRERLATVRELFEQPDRDLVNDAVRVAYTMPASARCEDDARLAAAAAAAGSTGAAVEGLRRRLARTRQLAISRRHTDALAGANAAIHEAHALGNVVLEAEARIAAADAHAGAGDYEDAAAQYEKAYFASAPLGADEVAITAAIQLVVVVGVRLARHDDGLAWARHAEVLLERLGAAETSYAADLANNTAGVLRLLGDIDAAKAAYEHSIALRTAQAGTEHPAVATTMIELASFLDELLAFPDALGLLEEAERILVAAHGTDALELAPVHNTRCTIEVRRGHYEAALPHCRRALDTREARLGPDHPTVASALGNLAAVLATLDDVEGARTMLDRAIAIRRARLGPQHPLLAASLSNLGLNDTHAGDYTAALAHYGEALQIRRATLPPGHQDIATTILNLADVELMRSRFAEAETLAQEAAAMMTGADDAIAMIRGRALGCIGSARLGRDDRRGAIEALEAAMLTPYATVGDPAARCEVRLELARALRPEDPERASRTASEARPHCTEAGARGSEILDELDSIARGQ